MKIKVLTAMTLLVVIMVGSLFFSSEGCKECSEDFIEVEVRNPKLSFVIEKKTPNNSLDENNQPPTKQEALDPVKLIYSWELWREDNGLSDEQIAIYDALDAETVTALAEQGQDIYAMQSASYEYVNQGKDDLAVKVLTRAAEIGSIKALFILSDIASVYSENVFQSPEDKNFIKSAQAAFNLQDVNEPEDLYYQVLVKGLAYSLVAAERGGIRTAKFALSQRLNLAKVPLKAEVWQDVFDESQAILNNLQVRRDYLGLDPFDNKPPETFVKKGWVDPNVAPVDVMKKVFFEHVTSS